MRILVVTANFAPRGASPAIRCVNLVRGLAQLDHEVIVITYTEKTLTLFSPYDESLVQKVPSNVRVIRINPGPLRGAIVRRGTNRDSNMTRKRKLLRNPAATLLIPDFHVDSIPAFIRAARQAASESRPDVVISFSYPHSMHVVGFWLKRLLPETKWIADYGDPWTGARISELPRPSWRRWVDAHLERRLLSRVDAVFVTTDATRKLYEGQFPELKGKVVVIPMGFDPLEFDMLPKLERHQSLRGKTLLVHVGRLYRAARNPEPFITALEELITREPSVGQKLQVVFVGFVEDEIMSRIANGCARGNCTFVPWLPQAESLSWMKAADYLLLFGNRGGLQVPGKVYQYLGAGKPILAFYETLDDPTLEVLREAGLGILAQNSKDVIRGLLRKIAVGEFIGEKQCCSETAVHKYSWSSISFQVSKVLNTLCSAS